MKKIPETSLTIQQRLEIYKTALVDWESSGKDTNKGLCFYLKEKFNIDLYFTDKDWDGKLSELLKQKPIITNECYWFPIREVDKMQEGRINCLKQAIVLTEKEIEQGFL